MSAQDLNIPSLFDVKGKIGKMIATGFARNGASVYIAARKEQQLKQAVEDIEKVATGKIHYIVANVASKAGCDALISEFKKRENNLHVLVNNSGVTWGGPYNDFPEEKGWDNVFNVNVKSIFYNYLIKDKTSTDPGRVINISSIASVVPHSEGELLAPSFVTVNAILPGCCFPSKMTAFGLKTSGDKLVSGQPMGRVGSPADMAGLALFLASPASAHITGAHIITDGGARLTRVAKL
ncbi:hypothetical protein B0H13DRAFT_1954376 [Mycena leptocephala]|nr:hypothetical protein B0H13DRAFT_1954376 [Mycena leptocephala]